ncbi:MAG: cellulase family glycosylhydrolase [Anaerolineales bacterium]
MPPKALFTCFSCILGLLLAAGCGASPQSPELPLAEITPAVPTITATATLTKPAPTEVPAVTLEPTPPPPEHRIGIRVVDGVGEFYDRLTGEKFIPRGNNYIRLAQQQGMSGETFFYHSTFNVGLYDPVQVDTALSRMHQDGYNVVRVFVQGGCRDDCIGDPAGGLSQAYIVNVADFLSLAKVNGIYVILTTDAEPGTEYYIRLLDTTWSENFGGTNSSYLTGGGVLVGKTFWRDLVEALLEQDAPLDVVFAYALRNEFFFETNAPPLSLTSGRFTTANGKTYDVTSEEERQRMMDEGLVYWIDEIRSEILESDPTALVTVGFFPPDRPNPWPSAPRFIRTYPAIWDSSIDFLDFHPYPGGYSLDKLVENFEIAGMQEKPILMGEFGAARSTYSSPALTARALMDWQVDSCAYGFDGWLLWTWDTEEQTDFYNGLTGVGEINQVLAPANRPDPCQPGVFDFFEYNLALGMPAIASRSLPDQPPAGAVDGTTGLWWGAGDFAPQWVQIDLGEPKEVGLIRLVITQFPAGETLHELWVGATSDQLYLLHSFEGNTVDGQVLEFQPDSPVEGVRFLRVITRRSPSWVGWQEIEVLAP